MATNKKLLVGFIGQGYVGGSYANNFERRGFKTVRYALEESYRANKGEIKECDIVFVCVPTPTTPKGFDVSIVKGALPLAGKGKIVVIKSTLQPGTTRRLQKKFPMVTIMCSPEFLSVATAQMDADSPFSNIIGIPARSARHTRAAKLVHSILPEAPFSLTCKSEEAEIIKYAHNFSGYTQVIAFNIVYDLARRFGCDWDPIQHAVNADPLIPNRYANPIHKSGRGAGGACFIKDIASLARLYRSTVRDKEGVDFLTALQKKNIALLAKTNKDLDLLKGVYGASVLKKNKKSARKTTNAKRRKTH
ncbi:hypothetical protein A2765_01295 [Candidatus Kaiserbacteria bacterium RIFCSPHIGHO2_01_FULL_56_24]|uniref:UDP-glucose/GDP-mannose dehydrogenase dimerisation domain-containing protein n=1 Tax=Candidatus Kaiserbacteria bacterium RIFCSPHIGHO2_01_FULL_56_24 TaxID=1798487 RepID=A0A1F6D967_9BACT|nr:MAG: hypothetical protein A2765_01295 [Candidatus Kaiserbacteria bacterium RIFCSPHIGHO2_01_FULL_56_24]